MSNKKSPVMGAYYVPSRSTIFPIPEGFWDFHSLLSNLGVPDSQLLECAQQSEILELTILPNRTAECWSCGVATTSVLAPFNTNLDNLSEAQLLVTIIPLCLDCYCLGVPVELEMSPERFTRYCLETFNSNMVLEVERVNAIGLNATYHLNEHLGQLSERVKKAVFHITPDKPTAIAPLSEKELFQLLEDIITICQEFQGFVVDGIPESKVMPIRQKYTQSEMEKLNACLGLIGEVSEVNMELMTSLLYPEVFKTDEDSLKKELGDLSFYLFVLIKKLGFSFGEVAWRVRRKLWKKYRGKFTSEASTKKF